MRYWPVLMLFGALQAFPQCVATPLGKGVWSIVCPKEPGLQFYVVKPSIEQWAEMNKPDTTKVKK